MNVYTSIQEIYHTHRTGMSTEYIYHTHRTGISTE